MSHLSEPWQAAFLIGLGLFVFYAAIYSAVEHYGRIDLDHLTDDERAWDQEVQS